MGRSRVLKIADFRNLFFGRVLTSMSLQAQAVMVGWHVYELSHDPLMLGLMGLVEAIPAIGFAFIAGHIVDNRRPARVYFWCVFALVVNASIIWLSALQALPIPAALRLGVLFWAVFVSGMVRSFASPSVFSMISHIVPRANQSEAAAWNSSSFQVAAILGPAAGGLLYGYCGPSIAFGLPFFLMLTALILIGFFSDHIRAMKSPAQREPSIASIRTAIQFTLKTKALLYSLLLDMLSVLFGGATAILPVFVDQVLHSGSQGLGFLRAAPSLGSALILLYLAAQPLRVISGLMLMFMVAGFGLSILGFAVSTTFVPAFVFLALSGAFDGVSMVIRGTVLQLLTPANMRGRISSLSLIFITSSNEIGAFESGLAAKVLGLIPSLIFGGCMTMAIVCGTAWLSPELRETRILPDEDLPKV
jgi:MFS family permease